ncbi:uncharacterized protein cd34 [Austrofundulus limnaeus]|uniref:Uncharacterized protein cd34 n=1 Tax=Austrofundulus limnaeus TaxID=52670 RepID=A0A2I4CDZ9_AUSLI|nr:PREDICTED: uncharacterized protein LOC106527773 [Austrofundulus limnaeus]
MSASMWRMNGLCGSMAGALLLCTMLFSCGVMGEGEHSNSTQSNGTGGPSVVNTTSAAHTQPKSSDKSISNSDDHVTTPSLTNLSDSSVKTFSPNVQCVGKEDIPEQTAVKAEVQKTNDCEETKRIIEENPSSWCSSDNCSLKIFQEGKTVLVSSRDVKPAAIAEALQSENVKKGLGLTKTEAPSSSGPSVFVGILVSGLLVAIGIIAWYFKCQRKPGAKDAKLAEEAFPVDKENQGNTLASEAPLNPPPETQEKPVNGESPEADKNPPPPTNGHSTAKTADTEL